MSRTIAVALTLAAAFFACRSSGDDTTGDDVQGDAPSGDVTIQEVQNDTMAPGTAVTLKGVVVTVIDKYGSKTGDFWVQEPGGGERSGVHVFGAPLAAVGALAVGDLVDIAGAQKDEFAYAGSNGSGADDSGRSITELKPVNGGMMTVTKVGSGTVPAPMVVDALAIGQKATQAERDAEWEKWEGVLITLKSVSAVSAAKCVGSACNDKSLNKIDLTGGIVLESSLAPLPGGTETTPGNVAKGDCLGSVTGVVDYFFDYLLLNTAADSVVTGGTGCPLAEAAALCTDSIDNDGNGFSDCKDNNCIVTETTCRAQATIPAVRAATPAGPVELADVYVTAIAFNKKNFWVASSLTATPNQGIYVFRGTSASVLPAEIVVGAKVTVIGTVTENNNDMTGGTVTQISGLAVNFVAAPTTPPVPVTAQTVDNLLQEVTGEPYEGVLVTLTNVKVVSVGTSATFYVAGLTQKTTALTPFKTIDGTYRFVTADIGKCYSTINGIWNYSVFDNIYVFQPRLNAAGTGVDGVVAPVATACD